MKKMHQMEAEFRRSTAF